MIVSEVDGQTNLEQDILHMNISLPGSVEDVPVRAMYSISFLCLQLGRSCRGILVSSCSSVRYAFLRSDILRTIWDMKLIFGIQYPDHMKMCWLTFERSALNIARVIFFFIKNSIMFSCGRNILRNIWDTNVWSWYFVYSILTIWRCAG